MLHPVWDPVLRGEPPDEAFVAQCLLGAGWVGGSRRLKMLDLRTWAALCALLREQRPDLTPDAEELHDRRARMVETTGYQLADRVFATEGGRTWAQLRRSLVRLSQTQACVRVVERDAELAAERVIEGYVPLVGELWIATTRLDLREPREWGALKGTASLRVELGYWPAQQVVGERCTWLDLDLLRALGPGVASRVWAVLEAWGRWPEHSFDGWESAAIGLGSPAVESLGVGGYARARQARMALDRAGRQIVAVDPAYDLVRCERRGAAPGAGGTGGWCLVARRVSGARARGKAREGGAWRSPGIAASKRNRPERSAVRVAIRGSLADAAAADRPA